MKNRCNVHNVTVSFAADGAQPFRCGVEGYWVEALEVRDIVLLQLGIPGSCVLM